MATPKLQTQNINDIFIVESTRLGVGREPFSVGHWPKQYIGKTSWAYAWQGGSMTISYRKPVVSTLALAISTALGLTATTAAQAYESPVHIFSVNDVLGDFDGSTYGNTGATEDKSIICGLPDSTTTCPEDAAQPFVDSKLGVELFPIDSEFGFYVVDFVGAQEKVQDGDYAEGWVGNLPDGSGVAVSNAITDRYKVQPPLGTWCQGLGGNSVKCSTEHYTVMEHVLSCHEVIPYFFADPTSGFQGEQATPDGSLMVDCATTALDDELMILTGGVPGEQLTDATPCLDKDPNNPEGCQLLPNDNTSVLNELATSTDYSVTLKDDGKPLYRWGALIKRPNDIRMYVRLALPAEWKVRNEDGSLANDFNVTKARLIINHTITNNPNDQLRPEDLENEAAIGVLPDHKIENAGTPDEVWRSTKLCYEGDGDLIDTEDGTSDPHALGIGTYFMNTPFALDPAAEPGTNTEDNPYAISEDLTDGLTNAWYTTIDREPFEWSYEIKTELEGGGIEVDYRGCPGPIDDPAYAVLCNDIPTDTQLFSGPRWRLKPNKFGQDLPGLEIPNTAGEEEACTPPPFTSSLIKYDVGAPTTTIINLLDWDENEGGPSPLATSKGWVDSEINNEFIEIVKKVTDASGEERQITSIGAPMSEDFDLTLYIKGDRKAVSLYNAQLVLEYEGEEPTEPTLVDMRLANLTVPLKVSGQTPESRIMQLVVMACNDDSDDAATGTITLEGVSLVQGIEPVNFASTFSNLAPLACIDATFDWTAPDIGTSITWTADVTCDGRNRRPGCDQQYGYWSNPGVSTASITINGSRYTRLGGSPASSLLSILNCEATKTSVR